MLHLTHALRKYATQNAQEALLDVTGEDIVDIDSFLGIENMAEYSGG